MEKKTFINHVKIELTKRQRYELMSIRECIVEDNENNGCAGFSLGTINNNFTEVDFVYVPEETARKIREILFPDREFID